MHYNRFKWAEERISELENSSMEIMQAEEMGKE